MEEKEPTSHENPSPVDSATVLHGQSPATHIAPGSRVGHYTILEVLGEGGFAVVYLAEQTEPVRRRVALKAIKLGMDTKHVLARFEAERQALAMMDHPCVAKVFDAGVTDDGRSYFVMEHVPGIPITEHCDHQRLNIEQRLTLFTQVCDAVQHAHQKGIIHRDLKPSNVLVSVKEGSAVPKVIDFGVAKALHQKLTEKTLFTEQGQLIGTPEYMSPEQAEMTAQDIDTRSDIYSLGVLLYELLTGALPFDPESLRKAAFAEIQRIIRKQEAPKPSTKLSSLGDASTTNADNRRLDPRSLMRELRGDLDWIVMKALEKDRQRRYETANALAMDLQRHLAHEPVLAGPPSPTYKLRKFVRRNRTGVITAAMVAAALVVATGVSIGFAISEAQQRRVAQAAEREQSRARKEAEQARTDEQKQRHIAVDARMEAETQRDVAQRESYVANIYAAGVALRDGETSTAKRRLARAPERLRNWEWGYLNAKADQSIATLRGHEGEVYSVAFSPDGTRLASGSRDKTIKLWDAATGDELATLRGHDGFVFSVAFSPDGTRLALALDKTIRVWDAATGDELATLRGHDAFVSSVAFSPDGTRLASASWDKTIRVWDAATGDELATLRGHERRVCSVAFSPDGTRLASASWDKTIRLWDAVTGGQLATLRGHEGLLQSVTFSPDGNRLASGSRDKIIKLWDAATGEQLATLRGHESGVRSVTFSPDGTRLASGSRDKTIKLWDAATGEELATFRGHEGVVGFVYSVAFSPDGTRLASASWDKTIRVWDAATGGQLATLRGHEGSLQSVAFSPDGTRLASASWDNTIRLWDAATGEELATLRGHERFVHSVAFSPDGTRLASASSDKIIKLWDAATGEELATLRGHEGEVRSVTFSPDGTRLASASGNKTIRLWDSVPVAQRSRERAADLKARSLMNPVVDRLFAELAEPSRIVEAIRDDSSVSDVQRHAALNLMLQRCSEIREQVREAHQQALTHFDQGQYDNAEPLLSTVLETVRRSLGPDSPETVPLIELLANLHNKQGRFDEARPYMAELISIRKRAAQQKDASADAINEYASLLLTCEPNDLRDPKAALAIALRVNEMTDHDNPSYLDTLSLAYDLTGDTAKAIENQEKAMSVRRRAKPQSIRNYQRDAERQDASADARNAYAWKLLTVKPVDLDDAKAALAIALRANEMTDHENPMYLDTLAMAYHLTGDHAKAVETQKKAIALLTPYQPRRDEYEAALAKFEAALKNESK